MGVVGPIFSAFSFQKKENKNIKMALKSLSKKKNIYITDLQEEELLL